MYYTYILNSISDPSRYYYGSSEDLRKRLSVHNTGGNISTRAYQPWVIVCYSGFKDKKSAMAFEKYLKTASGKAFARKRLI